MRVLLVVHGYPPSAMGGTEIYVQELASALIRDFGDEVHVLAREGDSSRPDFATRVERIDGVELTFVNNTFRNCR